MFVRPRAISAALACLLGLVVTGLVAYLVPSAQVRDADALSGYVELAHGRSDALLERIVALGNPLPYAIFAIGLIAAALAGRRYRLAALLPVVIVMAPLTAQVLKHVLVEPRGSSWFGGIYVSEGSWPSGHATASMTVALCAVLVAPQLLRPLAAVVGAAFTLAVSFAMLMLHAHFPSDIVGGYLCAGFWVTVAVAVLRSWEGQPQARRPALTTAEALPAATFVAALATIAAMIWLEQPRAALEYTGERPAFTASAIAIAMLAAVLPGLMARIAAEPLSR